MKQAPIMEGTQVMPGSGSFKRERVFQVTCYDHGLMPGFELGVVCNGKMPEKSIRQMLTEAWAKHRQEKHGGA